MALLPSKGGPSRSPPPSPACRKGSLKIQLQRELEGARGLLGSNRGERSRGRGGVRAAKHGLVEEVEHVRAEADPRGLGDAEALVEREIPPALRIESDIRKAQREGADIGSRCQRGSGAAGGEDAGIEPAVGIPLIARKR